MMIIIILILILFLIIYIFYNNTYYTDNLVNQISTVDNEEYFVRNVEDKSIAANTLATIKNNIKKLVLHLNNSISEHEDEKEYINNLVKRTKKINIMETPNDEKNTSYTINKGEKIVICLRSKFLNEIHDINTIMYVVIHELAHVG